MPQLLSAKSHSSILRTGDCKKRLLWEAAREQLSQRIVVLSAARDILKNYAWFGCSDQVFYLCVLDGGGFCPFAVADLLSGELAPANAATPATRRGGGDCRPELLIRAPSPHQFATALRTLSLNHKLA